MVTGWRWTSWLVVSTADELNSRLPSNNPSELSERDVQLRSSNNKSNAMADRLNSLGRELCALQIGSCTGLEVYYGAVSGSLSAPLYWLLRDCRVALETASKCAAQQPRNTEPVSHATSKYPITSYYPSTWQGVHNKRSFYFFFHFVVVN